MPALTVDRDTKRLAGSGPQCDLVRYPAKGGYIFYLGAQVCLNGSNLLVPGTQLGFDSVGRCEEHVSTVGLTDGAVTIAVRGGTYKWANNPDNLSTPTSFGTGSALFTATPKIAGVTLAAVQQSGASQPYGYTGTSPNFTLQLPTDGASAANGTPNGLDAWYAALSASDPLKLALTLSKATGTTGTLLAFSSTALTGYLGDTITASTPPGTTVYVADDQSAVLTSGSGTRGQSGKLRRVDSDGVYVLANLK